MTDTSGPWHTFVNDRGKGWRHAHGGMAFDGATTVYDYVAGVNGARANLQIRAVHKDTGEVVGPTCPACDAHHLGHDGSCLL